MYARAWAGGGPGAIYTGAVGVSERVSGRCMLTDISTTRFFHTGDSVSVFFFFLFSGAVAKHANTSRRATRRSFMFRVSFPVRADGVLSPALLLLALGARGGKGADSIPFFSDGVSAHLQCAAVCVSFVVPRLPGRSRRGGYMEFVEMEKGGCGRGLVVGCGGGVTYLNCSIICL